MDELQFRSDLYLGTASYYDRFRVPYPQVLLDDLLTRAGADGSGRLLDLATGPGLISLAMHDRFSETWAVDQEPGMIEVARQKATAAGIGDIRFLTSAAEDLSAPEDSFDLVAIGNAFHRLPREHIAARVYRWLRPGQFLALLWSRSPWDGPAPWQRALWETMQRWQARTMDQDRIPPRYDEIRSRRPDHDILRDAGFQLTGSYEFPVSWEWTADALIGFTYSTSVLSRAVLGDLAPAFEEDIRHEVCGDQPAGVLRQAMDFAYDLAQRPVLSPRPADPEDPFAEPGQPASLSCRLYRDGDSEAASAPSVRQLDQAIGSLTRRSGSGGWHHGER